MRLAENQLVETSDQVPAVQCSPVSLEGQRDSINDSVLVRIATGLGC